MGIFFIQQRCHLCITTLSEAGGMIINVKIYVHYCKIIHNSLTLKIIIFNIQISNTFYDKNQENFSQKLIVSQHYIAFLFGAIRQHASAWAKSTHSALNKTAHKWIYLKDNFSFLKFHCTLFSRGQMTIDHQWFKQLGNRPLSHWHLGDLNEILGR